MPLTRNAPAIRPATVSLLASVLVGAALTTTMVWRTSDAMFIGATDNATNSWTTGTVELSDDDGGSALFTANLDGPLTGGQSLTRCITVRYDGTLVSNTTVKLYGTASGTLGQHLDLTIDQGTGNTDVDCNGFSPGLTGIYSGTLANFAATVTNFSSGVGSWAPAATSETRVYRFTISVPATTAAQGKTANANFTWEAQG